MVNIILLDSKTLGADIDLSSFQELGNFTSYEYTSPEQVEERIGSADIIITNKVVLDSTNLKNAKNTKLIALTATGYNNVDIDYCKERGISVTNVSGYSTESVAQHTFSMLFYMLSSMQYYDFYVKTGEYSKSDVFTHLNKPWHELNNKQWGIIGLGEIGRSVAKKAESFGCKVVYYSTSGKNINQDYVQMSLEDLLSTSDIVSIHAPLNEKTDGLIGWEEISLMKESAILLNLGRGGIIDERALTKALNRNTIAGACLDVLGKEPIDQDNLLLKLEEPYKLLITPHIAWASIEARNRLVNEVYLNIKAFLNGEQRNQII